VLVILSSGYDASDLMKRFHHQKPQFFLQKTYRIESLRKIMDEVAQLILP